MDALEFRMEKIINHIISTTYPDKHFARLHVVFLRKDTKSFHGTYDPKKQLARIGNLSRSPAHIIATLLHEAAHHCELLLSGQTGRQRSFYLIYHDLMVSAIRMGLLSYEAVKDVSDSASIRQLERYFGPITETADPTFRYLPGKALLYAFNGFSHKDTLKPRGYHYNSRAKAWERVIDRRSRMNSLSYGPFRVSFPTLRMISWISRFWLPLWSPEIPIPKRIFSGPSISRTGRNFPERITAAGSNMSDRKRSRTTKMQFRSYREPLGSLLRSAIKCTFPGWNLSANTKRKAYYEKRKTNSQH